MTDQGKNAHSNVCKKNNLSPDPLIGPLLKNLPNWLSQKKKQIPETFDFSKTIFPGCRSNCW